jgi:hypothetical protein
MDWRFQAPKFNDILTHFSENHDLEPEDKIPPEILQLKENLLNELRPLAAFRYDLEKAEMETVADFNLWMARVYDWADRYKVWLGLGLGLSELDDAADKDDEPTLEQLKKINY